MTLQGSPEACRTTTKVRSSLLTRSRGWTELANSDSAMVATRHLCGDLEEREGVIEVIDATDGDSPA